MLPAILALALWAWPVDRPAAQPFAYSGGEIVRSPQVVAVYWGAQRAGMDAFLNDFYRRLTQSTYFELLAEYNPPGGAIGNVLFLGARHVKTDDTRSLDSLQIARELEQMVSSGELPPADEHTVYMVHFGPSVSTVMGLNALGNIANAKPGDGYCAYHLTTRTQTPAPVVPGLYIYGPKIRFAVVPDQDAPTCAADHGGLNGSTTWSASHELVEAIINPDSVIIELEPLTGANVQCNGAFYPTSLLPVPGVQGPPIPQVFSVINGKSNWAWSDSSGRSNLCDPWEIADACSFKNFSTTPQPDGNYVVTMFYLNSKNSCQISSVQGTVTDPVVNESHDLCVATCNADESACITTAFGQGKSACVSTAKACRTGCP